MSDTRAFWNVWSPNVSPYWQTTAQPKMGCVVCFYLLGFGYDRIARRFNLSRKHVSSFIQRRKQKIPIIGRTILPKIRPCKSLPYVRKTRKWELSVRKIKIYLRRQLWAWWRYNQYPKKSPLLMGCDKETFARHIVSQFHHGMTLDNYAEVWEFDHIIPCNQFDLSILSERHKCFHYTNIRPDFVTRNRKKSAKIFPHQPQLLLSIPPKAGLKTPRTVRTLPCLQQPSRNLSNQQMIKGAESCTPLTVLSASVNY